MIARSCRAAIGSVLLLLVASCTSDRRDTRAGARTPSFVWLAKADERVRFATAQDAARATLANLRTAFALDDRALASVDGLTVDASSIGPVVARFEQRDVRRGIQVFRAEAADAYAALHRGAAAFSGAGTEGEHAAPATKIPADGPQGNGDAPHPTGSPSGFTPTFGSMDLVTLQNYPFSRNDPWLPADATNTLGNNVRAYADLHAADGILGDDYLNVSGPKLFDHPHDPRLSPGATANHIGGSVARLFYVTNFLHDWYYGRGGLGHDALKAEAQDYDGRNDANATVPADGSAPRLQIYVFSGASVSSITVDSPAAITFDVAGSVVLGSDDQGVDPADGCETITTNLTGKIALVHRGLCSFIQKVQNAQAAGAAGVIVANVASSADPNTPPFMGGTTAAVTIPSLSLSLSLALADGAAAAIALPLVVSVTDPSFAAGHVASIETSARAQADEAAQSSAIDHVDTKATSWTVTADDGGTEPVPWSRSGPDGIRDRPVALQARRRQRSTR